MGKRREWRKSLGSEGDRKHCWRGDGLVIVGLGIGVFYAKREGLDWIPRVFGYWKEGKKEGIFGVGEESRGGGRRKDGILLSFLST